MQTFFLPRGRWSLRTLFDPRSRSRSLFRAMGLERLLVVVVVAGRRLVLDGPRAASVAKCGPTVRRAPFVTSYLHGGVAQAGRHLVSGDFDLRTPLVFGGLP